MRTSTPLVLLAALTAGATAQPKPTAPAPRSIDTFGAKLHAQVGKKPGNLIYSPSSIAIALAMTREGATGDTAKEMDGVLGAGAGADAKALVKSLGARGKRAAAGSPMDPEIAIANRLFGDQATPFVKRFLDITRDDYGAPIEGVDFRRKADQARIHINAWVQQQTHDRIKDLIPPGVVDGLTRLVLVNAIYMKAQWQVPFDAHATKPAAFTVDGVAAPRQVPTMNAQVPATYGAYAGARMLDLPYHAAAGGPRLAMLIVVPQSGTLAAIESTYAKEGLAGFLRSTQTHADVNVALPKFKVGSDFSLDETLQAMGMKRAFTEGQAEFGGMTTAARLHISKVIHKAWIEVDENGTEAAAATAVVMSDESVHVPAKVHDFKVDRSFAFFIHDEHGTVLFGGRVIDPSLR